MRVCIRVFAVITIGYVDFPYIMQGSEMLDFSDHLAGQFQLAGHHSAVFTDIDGLAATTSLIKSCDERILVRALDSVRRTPAYTP